jgi:hypothetical protein
MIAINSLPEVLQKGEAVGVRAIARRVLIKWNSPEKGMSEF